MAKMVFVLNSFTFPSSVFMNFSPNFLFVTCWRMLVQFSVCNVLVNVSSSYPCVTCYGGLVQTDSLLHTQITLYKRMTGFSSVSTAWEDKFGQPPNNSTETISSYLAFHLSLLRTTRREHIESKRDSGRDNKRDIKIKSKEIEKDIAKNIFKEIAKI